MRMRFILEGIRRVRTDRSLWPYVWRPLVWSGLIYLVLMVSGFIGAFQFSAWAVTTFGLPSWLGGSVGAVLFAVLWWFVSGIVFISLCSTFSAAAWDRLSMLVEQREGMAFTPVPWSRTAAMGDLLVRLAFGGFMGLLMLSVGWLAFGIVGMALAGLMGLLDFTSSAMARRGVGFFGQWGKVARLPDWASFVVGAGVIAATPFLIVFLYPSLVVAGTLMVRAARTPMGPALAK